MFVASTGTGMLMRLSSQSRPELERFKGQKDPRCLPKLIQDNAGAHDKAVNDGYFIDMPCELLSWPSDSPGLNSIEHIWEWVRRQISKRYGYLKADQVKGVWPEMWDELPIKVINKAMDHFMLALGRCVNQHGDNRFNGIFVPKLIVCSCYRALADNTGSRLSFIHAYYDVRVGTQLI